MLSWLRMISDISLLRESNASGPPFHLRDLTHDSAAAAVVSSALKAEVETLKRECETAKERYIDRTEDAQRYQALLELQRKENHRLRMTLEEWSRTNAKLESRLQKALDRVAAKSDAPSTSQGDVS